MHFLPLLILFTLLHQSLATVIQLTPENLELHITNSTSTPLLIQFYAPWCTHCSQFAPLYSHLAKLLSSKATTTRIDAHAHPILALRFRVRAYPTIFLIHNHNLYTFKATRSLENLRLFADSQGADPAVGKPHKNFFGPLGYYWRIVALGLRTARRAFRAFRKANFTNSQLIAFSFGTLAATLSFFLLLIYCLTKPTIRPHID